MEKGDKSCNSSSQKIFFPNNKTCGCTYFKKAIQQARTNANNIMSFYRQFLFCKKASDDIKVEVQHKQKHQLMRGTSARKFPHSVQSWRDFS